MEVFNNEWVIGIGGGILSGLIVTLITRYLFSKKDNREYSQKVDAVNKEVVYALRPGISEGHIPDMEVLLSLINATARKYKVNKNDTYQAKQIAEELIKEIMDSSFISSETKKSYCETLAHLVNEEKSVDKPLVEANELKAVQSDYRRKQTEIMSVVLGLTAAIGTMLVSITKYVDSEKVSSPLKSIFDVTLPTFVVLLAVMVTTMAMLISVRLGKLKAQKEETET
ncbi:hypothetical protein AB4238_20975 [Shewanella sp. 10N.286.45.A1]|uniref:hypothetical protein n=1 Tax=Shewanella sp. 10N.286.45.A1 TaxID=3229694 RepID=UPI0035501B7F